MPLCDVPDRCQDTFPDVRMPAADFIEQGVGFCVGHRDGEAGLGDSFFIWMVMRTFSNSFMAAHSPITYSSVWPNTVR